MIKDNSKIDELALKAFKQAASSKATAFSLEGLITKKEQIKFGRRILIAQAILAGKTRFEVNNHLSVSPNTFAQIKRWLENELQSYTSAHALKAAKKDRLTKELKAPFSLKHLQQVYPGHFLLVSLVEELFKNTKK